MQVQQFYDYTDMLKANLQSAITIGGKLQFKDDKQYQEFLDAGLIIGSLLVNSESANVYNTSDNTIWDAVEAKVTLWGGDPANDMNLRHLALVEVLEPLSAPDDILVQIEKVRVVAKFDVVDETKIQFGDTIYVEADPFTKMLIKKSATSTEKCYRIFLDPVNGDDLKDGQSWANAVKSVSGALDKLPSDLNGYQAHLFFAPGVYDGSISLKRFSNGEILFTHMTKLEIETMEQERFDEFKEYLGLTTFGVAPFDAGKVQFKNTNPESSTSYLIDCTPAQGSGLSFTILNINFGTAWNADGHYAPEVFEFIGPDVTGGEAVYSSLILLGNCSFYIDQNKPIFNLKGLTGNAIQATSNTSMKIKSFTIIGGDGNASVATSGNAGFLVMNGQNVSLLTEDWKAFNYIDQDTGEIATNQKRYTITGIRQLIYSQVACNYSLDLDSTSVIEYFQGDLPDTDKPKITLNAGDTGSIKVHDTLWQLIDNSVVAHTVYKNGVLTSYIGGGLKKQTSTIIPISTTVPADEELANKDVVFYMDEATDTLKVKYKDSGGVVQTGEIAVLT